VKQWQTAIGMMFLQRAYPVYGLMLAGKQSLIIIA
jgi:hypothetical protein